MKKYVLFSAVGDSDPYTYSIGENKIYDAAILNIVRHYKPIKVFLFLTAEMETYKNENNAYELSIKHILPECEVEHIKSNIKKADDYDAYYNLFSKQLIKISKEYPNCQILLNLSSATPQIKSTMFLLSVSHHLKLTPVQVSSPNESSNSKPHYLKNKDIYENGCFSKEIFLAELDKSEDERPDAKQRHIIPPLASVKKSIVKNQIKQAISYYDYHGAFKIAQEYQDFFSKKTLLFLEHSFLRAKPDYNGAELIAKKLEERYPGLELYKWFYPITDNRQKDVCEYYLSLKIKQMRDEIADFILRLKVITEELLKDYLELHYNVYWPDITYKESSGEQKLDRRRINEKYKNLVEVLDKLYSRPPHNGIINLKTLIRMLTFFDSKNNLKKDFDSINKVNGIRNDIAHTLDDITESDLEKLKLSSKTLCEIIERIIQKTYKLSEKNCSAIFNKYDYINKGIVKELDR